MRKKIKRILLWLIGIFLLLTGISVALVFANKDKIINQVTLQLNQYLNAPIEVAKLDITLKTFPSASVQFSEVFCAGRASTPGDTLIYSDEILLQFDLWKIFDEDITINKIQAKNGILHINIPEKGNANYEIWKSDSSSSGSSTFALESVVLENFKTHFYEGTSQTDIQAFVNTINLKGSFQPDSYTLSGQLNMALDSLTVEGETYLRNTSTSGAFELEGTGAKGLVKNGRVSINDVESYFTVNYSPEVTKVEAWHNSVDLEKAYALILDQGWYDNSKLKPSGAGEIAFTGNFPSEEPYNYKLTLNTNKARLSGISGASLKNLKLRARYIHNASRSDLHLDSFSADGETGKLQGQLSLVDLSSPFVEGKIKSELSLEEWLIFIPTDTLINPEGKLAIDVYFKNQFSTLENIQASSLKNARTNGTLELKNIGFSFKGGVQKIYDVNSQLAFSNNDLLIDKLALKIGKSDINLKGKFINAINYAFFNGEKLRINADLSSDRIILEDFLNISVEDKVADAGSSKSEAEEYSLDITQNLSLNLRLSVNDFSFETFSASDISGNLNVKNGVISAREISLRADEGQYKGEFKINTYLQPMVLQANLKAQNIQLNQVFKSFQNFGQEAILAQNIYGKTDLSVNLKAEMDKYLNIDPSSLDVLAQVEIEDGSLQQYDPMLALSDFAAIDELRYVKFARLENQIRIKNSVIHIPRMEIQSNVMNLGLEGTHNFENIVDYSLRLKMGDVMFNSRKRKNQNSEFDEHLSVTQNDDDPNIYIKLQGPAADPDIKLDQSALGKSIGKDLKQEGSEFKKIFSKEDKRDKGKEKSGITYDLFGDDDQDDSDKN